MLLEKLVTSVLATRNHSTGIKYYRGILTYIETTRVINKVVIPITRLNQAEAIEDAILLKKETIETGVFPLFIH